MGVKMQIWFAMPVGTLSIPRSPIELKRIKNTAPRDAGKRVFLHPTPGKAPSLLSSGFSFFHGDKLD